MNSNKNTCARKVRHETKERAMLSLWYLVDKAGVYKGSLQCYKCSICSGYHVGSVPKKYRKKRKATRI